MELEKLKSTIESIKLDNPDRAENIRTMKSVKDLMISCVDLSRRWLEGIDNNDYKFKFEELVTATQEVTDEIQDCETRLDELETMNQHLIELKCEKDELERKIDDIKELENEINEVSVVQIRQEFNLINETFTLLKTQYDQNKSNLTEITEKKSNLEGELRLLDSEIAQIDNAINDLLAQNVAKTQERDSKRIEMKDLEQKLSVINDDLAAIEKNYNEYEELLQKINSDYIKMKSVTNDGIEKYEDSYKINEDLLKIISDIKNSKEVILSHLEAAGKFSKEYSEELKKILQFRKDFLNRLEKLKK